MSGKKKQQHYGARHTEILIERGILNPDGTPNSKPPVKKELSPFDVLAPVCPKCGNFAFQSQGKFGVKSSCCGLWSWKGKPLVDHETHRNRILAHEAFDQLWKDGHMTRTEAYQWLRDKLGMARQPHMSEMSAAEAARVVEVVEREWVDKG